jgi:hypothetical protein
MTCSPNADCILINHGASTRSAQAAQRHVITRPQPPSQLAPRYAIHFHASLTAPRVTHNFDTYSTMHVLGRSRLHVTVLRRNGQSLQVFARVMAAIGCSESYVCIKRGHVPRRSGLASCSPLSIGVRYRFMHACHGPWAKFELCVVAG